MKTLFFTFVLLAANFATAEGLYFGSTEAKATKNEYCFYNISVPQVAPGANATPVQIAAIATLNSEWKQQAQALVADYDSSVAADKDMCSDYSFSYNVSADFEIKLAFGSPVASLLFSDYYYTGGAHGGLIKYAQTFNQETGEQYAALNSFVADTQLDAVKALIEARLLENDENFDVTFGWNDWKATTVSTAAISNFYVNTNGIVIFFNEYEVGPYAAGPMEAQLYWYELAPLLNKTAPANLLPVPQGI